MGMGETLPQKDKKKEDQNGGKGERRIEEVTQERNSRVRGAVAMATQSAPALPDFSPPATSSFIPFSEAP